MQPAELERLIARVALGDRQAFALLYDSTAAKLFGACLRILKDRGEAEAAVQEAYVKIWQRADSFAAGRTSPVAWLVAIARHQAIDMLRRQRGPQANAADLETAAELADPSPGPERAAAAAETVARIDTCLEELERDRAAAVRAAYVEGFSYQELATRYAVPLNTMRTWLRRSLLRLRECLER